MTRDFDRLDIKFLEKSYFTLFNTQTGAGVFVSGKKRMLGYVSVTIVFAASVQDAWVPTNHNQPAACDRSSH